MKRRATAINKPRWSFLLLLALLSLPLLWPFYHLSSRYYQSELMEQNRQTLDLYVANLLGSLTRYEALPQILSDSPALLQALRDPADENGIAAANQLLSDIRLRTGADVLYLLDEQGRTLAASNWQDADSFVGGDFAYRPYFKEALRGELGQFFGLGAKSDKRGYYFAHAVRDQQRIIGVLAVKIDLAHTETLWGNTPERLMVTDDNGVVILTSNPAWRYHATRALSAGERQAISVNRPYPSVTPAPLSLDERNWLRQSRYLDQVGWTAQILTPRAMLVRQVQTVMAIAAGTLVLVLLLLGLWMQRRRHFAENLSRSIQVRQELEEHVQQRTQDLETLNTRLKQEVLEREQAQQELVRTQDELVQASKLSALGTMSASISHELNQPLAAIRSYAGNASTLLDHQRVDEARTNLDAISELTDRMASIIAHLRAFARRDRHAPEPVGLQSALDDALSLIAKRRRLLEVELHRDLPEATIWVQAGETRLRQVLGNLLSNALDALSEIPPPRHLWLSLEDHDHYVDLIIRDNGPGFSEQALQRAREPFFTTKTSAQGLGLGLAICDTLMRALGGELILDNHEERGAMIRVRLLRARPSSHLQPAEDVVLPYSFDMPD